MLVGETKANVVFSVFVGETKANVVALERDGYDFGAGVEGFHHTRLHTVISKGKLALEVKIKQRQPSLVLKFCVILSILSYRSF